MILDLRQFESFPAQAVLKADPEKIDIEFDSVVRLNDMELKLNIQKSGEEYYCQGKATASVRLTCSRCLTEFDVELADTTNFIICSKAWHESHRDVHDNEEYVYFQGGDLQADLTDVVREAVIVELSIKPLCSQDCHGLCPQCGVNLNETTCGCRKDQIDDRWAALKKLSQQQGKQRNY